LACGQQESDLLVGLAARVTEKPLAQRLKTSLDELRMQTMGTQILFGFQFQSLFQPGFDQAGTAERAADAGSLAAILISFAVLIIAPAQHRLVEPGQASRRLLKVSRRCAELALGTMAIALGCISFSITTHLHLPHSGVIAALVTTLGFILWFGSGIGLARMTNIKLPERESMDLHTRIDQMLTEARVILPGVQAMMGFQLIVVMTDAFGRLPQDFQNLHLAGLALTTLSTLLLLTPAAVHRVAFSGEDDARFHVIGTRLVGAALMPLAAGMAAEVFIGTWRLFGSFSASLSSAVFVLFILVGAWYALPLWLRTHITKEAA
jgi:hypothetical protein